MVGVRLKLRVIKTGNPKMPIRIVMLVDRSRNGLPDWGVLDFTLDDDFKRAAQPPAPLLQRLPPKPPRPPEAD